MEAGLYLCPLPGVVQRWMAGFRSFKPVFKLKSEAILLRQGLLGMRAAEFSEVRKGVGQAEASPLPHPTLTANP